MKHKLMPNDNNYKWYYLTQDHSKNDISGIT
jgi:hypothetical protein